MFRGTIRAARFALNWTDARVHLLEEEVRLDGPGPVLDATLYRPSALRAGPAWVLLHGMTRTGRRHTSLVRFARAIAATGATVLVPEVPEWVELDLAPHRTLDTVQAGVAFLEQVPAVTRAPGLMGFSFGGPQALRVAGDPTLSGRISCVASFGGYGALDETLGFLLTGIHHWEGRAHRVKPDPYGRWIVVANFLTRIPGFADAGPVAEGLRSLARYAGDQTIHSWDAALDPVKDRVAETIPDRWRPLFRFFAPPAGSDPPSPSPETEGWARRLARTGVDVHPELALPDRMEIPVPTYLVHGRNDHLIPFSEVHRLAHRVAAPRTEVLVTGLFAHSAGDPRPHGPVAWTREVWGLGRTLSRLFAQV